MPSWARIISSPSKAPRKQTPITGSSGPGLWRPWSSAPRTNPRSWKVAVAARSSEPSIRLLMSSASSWEARGANRRPGTAGLLDDELREVDVDQGFLTHEVGHFRPHLFLDRGRPGLNVRQLGDGLGAQHADHDVPKLRVARSHVRDLDRIPHPEADARHQEPCAPRLCRVEYDVLDRIDRHGFGSMSVFIGRSALRRVILF